MIRHDTSIIVKACRSQVVRASHASMSFVVLCGGSTNHCTSPLPLVGPCFTLLHLGHSVLHLSPTHSVVWCGAGNCTKSPPNVFPSKVAPQVCSLSVVRDEGKARSLFSEFPRTVAFGALYMYASPNDPKRASNTLQGRLVSGDHPLYQPYS